MRLITLGFIFLSTSFHYSHVFAANSNRNLNIKPTSHKSGKNDKANGAGSMANKGSAQHGVNGTTGISNGNSNGKKGSATTSAAAGHASPGASGGTVTPGMNPNLEEMMKPLNEMFKGNGEGLNIENIMNSNPNGGANSGQENLFKDMISAMNAMGGGAPGAAGGANPMNANNVPNISISPEQMNQINELKDKLENVLKNAGVDVEQLKENMQNENIMQNKDAFKDLLANLPMNPAMMQNMMGGKDGNMLNMDHNQMMDMLNQMGQGKMNMKDFGMKDIGMKDIGMTDFMNPSHGNHQDTESASRGKAYVTNSSNNDINFADKLNAFEDSNGQPERMFNLYGMNDDDGVIDDGMSDSVGKNDTLDVNGANVNRNLSDGDSAKEDSDESQANSTYNNSTSAVSNKNNHESGSTNEVESNEEELITSSGNKGDVNKLAANSGYNNNNPLLDLNNLKKDVNAAQYGKDNVGDRSNGGNTNGGNTNGGNTNEGNNNKVIKKRVGGKKKKKMRKKNPGQIPFKMETLQKLVKEYTNTSNQKIMEQIIKKYVSLNNQSNRDNNDEDDDEEDVEDEKSAKEKNSEKEEELNMNEFSVKDIKKLISEGILTYEDLTEEELKKLAKPDDMFYELSPYANEEKDLSLNETSGVSNEQLNAFLRKNGSYHMSYDSKAIDYLKQKKAEKKEEEQEDDSFYDAYKQIKNSYEGIPSNYYHDAPQLIGDNYVFTSVYDKKKELIDFLKRSHGITDESDSSSGKDKGNSAEGSTYKSKYYDKYMKKLSEYRRREAFKILKKRRAQEKKLQKKKEMQNNTNNEVDYSEYFKKNGFINSSNGTVKTFSKDQLDNMVKHFNNGGEDFFSSSGAGADVGVNHSGISGGGQYMSSSGSSNPGGYVTFDGQNVVGSNDNEEEESNEDFLNEDDDNADDDV
ncbi:translocon component PTEX150 [Plasmodium cynomolgi strain B]|uniref:Translocon component PTEX150 n=1 Tax=Plasmodium cynomolgi (strain B) TaxID=1120755 RepID=K6UEH3_PLACD|nr:translocon component PTEX150 [Plasmodium cynomolgi strain B]GAB68351.1 translocon component PTEX150 [Plasmodium cynomolgi strain B]